MCIRAVDLFCGAGGTSTGLLLAAEELGIKVDLLAINHSPVAIETHSTNHSAATHLCESLDGVDPRKIIPGGCLHLLAASPECTHHSIARGGKPMNDQSRASAWHVLRWAEALRIDNILIENVKEFQSWGPLGVNGRPMKSRNGETFRAFLSALRSLGYTVDFKILNAADYGDPTTRERLFILARRGRKPIQWPEPTHSRNGNPTFWGERQPWRAAKEIIDWSIPSRSIFNRKRPLAPATINRIIAGLRKFGGKSAEPFIVVLRNHGDASSLSAPLPTLTASGTHFGLCEPFVIGQQSGAVARTLDEPLPTVATKGAIALVEPYLVRYNGTGTAESVSNPLPTVTAKDRFALVESGRSHDADHRLDIRFRMLQPHELARAMSFPDSYAFAGNRSEKVKQIGNAVPVGVAKALCRALLEAA